MTINKDIFDTSEIIISQNVLWSKSIWKSAYACFDSFDDSKKNLTLWEWKLCTEFLHIIDEFTLSIQNIIDFTNSIDYEKLFIKNMCYTNLDCYGNAENYAFFQQIENYWYSWTLKIEVKSLFSVKDNKFEVDIVPFQRVWVNVKRKIVTNINSFEIHCDQENFLEMYAFISQTCLEIYNNPIISDYDVEDTQLLNFSYILDDSTEIDQKILKGLKKLWLEKESIDILASEKIHNFSLWVHFKSKKNDNNSEKIDDKFYDDIGDEDFQEVDEEPEFTWSENKIEILAYLDNLLETRPLPKLVLIEHFNN